MGTFAMNSAFIIIIVYLPPGRRYWVGGDLIPPRKGGCSGCRGCNEKCYRFFK